MPERVAAAPAKAGLKEDGAGTEWGVIEGPAATFENGHGLGQAGPQFTAATRGQPGSETSPIRPLFHLPTNFAIVPKRSAPKECARSVPQRREGQPHPVLCQGGEGRGSLKSESKAQGAVGGRGSGADWGDDRRARDPKSQGRGRPCVCSDCKRVSGAPVPSLMGRQKKNPPVAGPRQRPMWGQKRGL